MEKVNLKTLGIECSLKDILRIILVLRLIKKGAFCITEKDGTKVPVNKLTTEKIVEILSIDTIINQE